MTSFPTPVPPRLPDTHGPISEAVINQLGGRAPHNHLEPVRVSLRDPDPFELDLQLALHVCYELHYRGFVGVDPEWEWNAGLLHLRSQLERVFLAAVRRKVGPIPPDATAADEMDALSSEPEDGTGTSGYLRDHATWTQMREYFVHRSLYHLKEGDPHAWLIPRLSGQAKSSFVAVEFDEYGAATAPGFINRCSPT